MCERERQEPPLCKVKSNEKTCGKPHHELLHGTENNYCQANSAEACTSSRQDNVRSSSSSRRSFFEIFKAMAAGPEGSKREAIVFTDPGSSLNFIRDCFAELLKLEGVPVTLNLRVVNSSYRELKTKTYVLTLLDRDGRENEIEAIGIPTITDTGPAGEMSEIRKLFPEAPSRCS